MAVGRRSCFGEDPIGGGGNQFMGAAVGGLLLCLSGLSFVVMRVLEFRVPLLGFVEIKLSFSCLFRHKNKGIHLFFPVLIRNSLYLDILCLL